MTIPRLTTFALVLLLATPVVAQDRIDDPYDIIAHPDEPWIGWVGPLADGLYGLRFGIDGFTVRELLGAKGLEGRSPRDGTLRYVGDVLGEPAEVLTEFYGGDVRSRRAQLSAVQIRWELSGLPVTGMRLFARLETMLEERYGEPLHSETGGRAALENGNGLDQRIYFGPEARAILEIRSIGRDLYALAIRVESPQLKLRAEADEAAER